MKRKLLLLFTAILFLSTLFAMGEDEGEFIPFEEESGDELGSWLMEPYFLSSLPELLEKHGIPQGADLTAEMRYRIMENSSDDEIDDLFSTFMSRISGNRSLRIRLNEYLYFYKFSYSTVRAMSIIGDEGIEKMNRAFPDGWPKGIGCYDAFRMASENIRESEEETGRG